MYLNSGFVEDWLRFTDIHVIEIGAWLILIPKNQIVINKQVNEINIGNNSQGNIHSNTNINMYIYIYYMLVYIYICIYISI